VTDSPTLEMNSKPVGVMSVQNCASCPAPLGMMMVW